MTDSLTEGIEVKVLSDDGNDIDGDDFEPRDEEDEGDLVGENDSISNMSLLKPPRKRSRSRRRKAKDSAHVHSLAGITGVYKSTPASPKRGFLVDNKLGVDSDDGPMGDIPVGTNDVGDPSTSKHQTVGVDEREKKKRVRTKRSNKTLTRIRSYPNLKVEVEIQDSRAKEVGAQSNTNELESSKALSASSDTSQRGRMLSLARHLQEQFPEQHQELKRVVTRLERVDSNPLEGKGAMGNSEGSGSGGGSSLVKSSPIAIPGKKLRRPKKLGHSRAASEGMVPGLSEMIVESPLNHRPITDVEEEGEEGEEAVMIDPRGRPPRKKDPLMHVFIDQYEHLTLNLNA